MTARDRAEFFLFKILVAGIRALPESRRCQFMAWLGPRLSHLPGLRRSLVMHQMRRVYGELDDPGVQRLTDEMYRHLGLMVAEVLGGDLGRYKNNISVVPGWEALDAALGRGRGAIVATAHVGNFELGGWTLAQRYSLLDVVKTQRNPLFDRFLQQQRHRYGIQTVPMDESGAAVIRHLRRGGLVSLLLDQDAGAQGVFADWLNLPASTWPGAARISIRTGCPVVPMALLRTSDSEHQLVISEPLWPEGLTDTPADVKNYLNQITRNVSHLVEISPEQWFWVHRRWKSRPTPSTSPGIAHG